MDRRRAAFITRTPIPLPSARATSPNPDPSSPMGGLLAEWQGLRLILMLGNACRAADAVSAAGFHRHSIGVGPSRGNSAPAANREKAAPEPSRSPLQSSFPIGRLHSVPLASSVVRTLRPAWGFRVRPGTVVSKNPGDSRFGQPKSTASSQPSGHNRLISICR